MNVRSCEFYDKMHFLLRYSFYYEYSCRFRLCFVKSDFEDCEPNSAYHIDTVIKYGANNIRETIEFAENLSDGKKSLFVESQNWINRYRLISCPEG